MNRDLPLDLSPIIRHLEFTYPSEGCGVLLRKDQGGWRVLPMVNVYDRYHGKDPVRFPRTSRTAYLFDPREWLRVLEEAERSGEQVACVFHSHIDAGAYFSAEDRIMAAPDGDPLLPGVTYLVVAIDAGLATGATLFWWESGEFKESAVSLSGRQSQT